MTGRIHQGEIYVGSYTASSIHTHTHAYIYIYTSSTRGEARLELFFNGANRGRGTFIWRWGGKGDIGAGFEGEKGRSFDFSVFWFCM